MSLFNKRPKPLLVVILPSYVEQQDLEIVFGNLSKRIKDYRILVTTGDNNTPVIEVYDTDSKRVEKLKPTIINAAQLSKA